MSESVEVLQIIFQLITSLDLSFEDLVQILQRRENKSSMPETDLFIEFFENFSSLSSADSMSAFVERIDFSVDAMDKEWAEMMRSKCHPKSLIGMFLRRIVIHFKRMSFNEVTMLVSNVDSYIKSSEFSQEFYKETVSRKVKFKEPKMFQKLAEGPGKKLFTFFNLEAFCRFDLKLKEKYVQTFQERNNRNIGVEARNKLILLSKTIKHKVFFDEKAENSPTKKSENETLKEDQVEPESRPQLAESSCSKILKNIFEPDDEDEDEEFGPWLDGATDSAPKNISQLYLVNQVSMILLNEKRSLPPEEILNLVENFYKKHNSFQNQQAIHSNYRMNIRNGSKNAQLDSASSLTNSDSGHGNDIANLFSKRFGDVNSSNNFHKYASFLIILPFFYIFIYHLFTFLFTVIFII